MEMTDVEGQENQGHGSSEKKPSADHQGPERQCSFQRGCSASKLLHGSLSNVDDFEEFVLDFDDYDLLESIHTQLGSPEEPVRKFMVFHKILAAKPLPRLPVMTV